MNPRMNGSIALIGVPMDMQAERRGVDMGPSALRCAGVVAKLEELGYRVHDRGDIAVCRPQSREAWPCRAYLDEIHRVEAELSMAVSEEAEAGRFPLVLGGDRRIAIASISGWRRQRSELGVIWFDAYGDKHQVLSTRHPLAEAIGGRAPPLQLNNVAMIGARSLSQEQCSLLKREGVAVYTMRELEKLGMKRVMEQALELVTRSTDGVHLSFSLDALDPYYAPGVGAPVPGGLTFRECYLAMELLSQAGAVTSADVVEVNPIMDTRNQTATTAVALLGALFGGAAL